MTYNFGDSFDLYALPAETMNGYWDAGGRPDVFILGAGRFSGSRALNLSNTQAAPLTKTSGVNDAVHHIVVSALNNTLSGTQVTGYITLYDGATAQCTIVFQNNGNILLTSGLFNGATIATFTAGIAVINTWYGLEFEVVIGGGTSGSFAVRRNGNTVNDFTATGLNTAPSGNAYANKIGIGNGSNTGNIFLDDLFWRSGAASGSWLGDLRCYTRMPASDQSVQFSRTPAALTQTTATVVSNFSVTAGRSMFVPFTPNYSGAIATATVQCQTGYTGNMKCAIFASAGSLQPGAVLATATPIANPPSGAQATFTFPSPLTVVAGTQYFIGFCSNTSSGLYSTNNVLNTGSYTDATSYAAFPVSSPSGLITSNVPAVSSTVTITPSSNSSYVAEAQQDGLTTYVFDNVAGHADFYGLSALGVTPVSIVATTVRAYAQKSDAGGRIIAAQLKSSAAIVASPSLSLSAGVFQWASRLDLTDPNTGAAWTQAAIDAAQIGPKIVA